MAKVGFYDWLYLFILSRLRLQNKQKKINDNHQSGQDSISNSPQNLLIAKTSISYSRAKKTFTCPGGMYDFMWEAWMIDPASAKGAVSETAFKALWR